MPRADKTLKEKKAFLFRIGKTERSVLKEISHAPKFPENLVGLKKERNKK